MYIKCTNDVRLCNHCCSVKAVTITHSACVFVALSHPSYKGHALYYNAICGPSGSSNFSTLLHKEYHLWKKVI